MRMFRDGDCAARDQEELVRDRPTPDGRLPTRTAGEEARRKVRNRSGKTDPGSPRASTGISAPAAR